MIQHQESFAEDGPSIWHGIANEYLYMTIGNHTYKILKSLENQFIYPSPKGSKLIFFAPLGVGVNEENQWVFMHDS